MPEPLGDSKSPFWRQDAAIGFYGKIPARGDFVHVGLPRGFIDPWHAWMERMLAASRAVLGEEWRPAWLEAAVWRFALPAGLCGTDAVVGLWLPSVDRVGRYFPLTFAQTARSTDLLELVHSSGSLLRAAEQAGRAALEDDLGPEALAARFDLVMDFPTLGPDLDPALLVAADSVWWTDGAPRVPPRTIVLQGLPDAATFTAMLDARTAAEQPLEPVSRE